MDTISLCLILIPALPLAAAIIVALFGASVLREASHWPVIVAIGGSFLCSMLLVREILAEQSKQPAEATGFERVVTLWTWANIENAYDLKPTAPSEDAATAMTPSDAGWKDFRIDVALRADALTSMMLSMVTFVATLVAIFGAGYMHGDRGYWRFFAYVGLFVFSMTMLVSVSNFVLLFVFWEAVGVCSYLLIGFWYTKPEAAAAGMKAFLVNRVGDFGFALALFLIWTTYGTLNYHDTLRDGTTNPESIAKVLASSERDLVNVYGADAVAKKSLVRGVLGQLRLQDGLYVGGAVATAICLLLLVGACGKSAQFPLHVWLPDAMEGPTPVSALIHAATMVTAGVYMITRCTPLFMMSPTAQLVVAIIGGFTALLAGLIALTQFDLKRVLAYSTVSQLGYMFLALGVGTFAGITGGMFHLFTHAFFKALLFLGAGSVMHAMGNVIDMRQFGGLRKLMPHTHWTFLCGCLALAGLFPLAGFWSKDSILGAVHEKVHELEHEHHHRAHGSDHPPAHVSDPSLSDKVVVSPLASLSDAELVRFAWIYNVLYYSGLFTAFLTAFYTFRAFFMTFYGEERIPPQAGHHAHESPPLMTGPLMVLAVCAVIIGVIWMRDGAKTNLLVEYIGHTPSLAAGLVATTRPAVGEFHLTVAALSSVVAIAGILLALYLYLGERTEANFLRDVFELKGVERFTDPQWVLKLEQVWWIGQPVRWLRCVGLGFVVTAVGLMLGVLSMILAIPLLLGQFMSPYRLSQNKFYFDELYYGLIVWPLRLMAQVCYWIDRWIIDGLVNAFGWFPQAAGSLMRSLQMGLVQFYAAAMVLGVVVLLAARMLWAG
ncbi:NADH-quinone oxidoreductase subunit L [Anatilimnocola aggregata]|uniref:NADH-quinone oxidoreductase subunit L n=1 Tax=Anatilimnocola aggregata TaxID=2528021 RepID=A0A517YA61_9BACT|nr:NADH-quinone oxidoreductase subunit L [Anatilimnocola aggregata]QDU27104.1 NADH-quinone oxidoreductase subunit L [Anatilimnocola aggregata]